MATAEYIAAFTSLSAQAIPYLRFLTKFNPLTRVPVFATLCTAGSWAVGESNNVRILQKMRSGREFSSPAHHLLLPPAELCPDTSPL